MSLSSREVKVEDSGSELGSVEDIQREKWGK